MDKPTLLYVRHQVHCRAELNGIPLLLPRVPEIRPWFLCDVVRRIHTRDGAHTHRGSLVRNQRMHVRVLFAWSHADALTTLANVHRQA